jgi:hypothetical protein
MSIHAIYENFRRDDDGDLIVRVVDTDRAQRTWTVSFERVDFDEADDSAKENALMTSTLLLSSAGRWYKREEHGIEPVSPAEWLADYACHLSEDDIRAIADAASLPIE